MSLWGLEYMSSQAYSFDPLLLEDHLEVYLIAQTNENTRKSNAS